jgi:Phage gp6-like head-tail connector protein
MMNTELVSQLKEHIRWDESMDDSMLSFYIEQAKRYVQSATGQQTPYLVVMCAGIFYEYRVAEKELKEALDAMTPFFLQEVYDATETE